MVFKVAFICPMGFHHHTSSPSSSLKTLPYNLKVHCIFLISNHLISLIPQPYSILLEFLHIVVPILVLKTVKLELEPAGLTG
jgi:hypothetical protein